MTKEIEALKRIETTFSMNKQGKESAYREYTNSIYPYYEDFDLVLNALKRLEATDNANPSKALKCLEILGDVCPEEELSAKKIFCEEYDIIKQALLKAQEQEKEQITRDDLVQIIEDVFGDIDKFLDMIDDDNLPINFTCIYQDEELYIIDNYANRYIHWYKKTHIGRDFHTDMRTKEEIKEFFKRLSKGNIETDLV